MTAKDEVPNRGQYSLLQWLGPELARQGLLKNEEWVPQHVETVEKMFANARFQIIAGMMVAISPRSLDYIQQAPVLVAAAARGMQCDTVDERKYVAHVWLKDIREHQKLKDLMRHYGLAPQLRALKGKALGCTTLEYRLTRSLREFDPMRIAQSIPGSIVAQRNWISGLVRLREQLARRFDGSMLPTLMQWAMFALSRHDLRRNVVNADTLADFAGANARTFNFKWTWEQAVAAETRWRDMLAKQSQEQRFFENYKIGWEEPIDYRGLPLEIEIDGFQFVALNTGAALFAEGRDMRHCVASYTQNVLRGHCFIFGIRVGERRHATLELAPGVGKGMYRAAQLKGPCNSRVSVAIRDAVGQFMRRVNRVDIAEIDPSAVIQAMQQPMPREHAADLLRLIGEN